MRSMWRGAARRGARRGLVRVSRWRSPSRRCRRRRRGGGSGTIDRRRRTVSAAAAAAAAAGNKSDAARPPARTHAGGQVKRHGERQRETEREGTRGREEGRRRVKPNTTQTDGQTAVTTRHNTAAPTVS